MEEKIKNRGLLTEYDNVTELINRFLKRISSTEKTKATILIIDDLDRLDPEHIFRLFNIFSSQYDDGLETNRFGFDKVVFVCDLSNIRKIYAHRYGQDVDFSGYIDKFYSFLPFEFDSLIHISGATRQILNYISFKIGEDNKTYSIKSNFDNFHSTFAILAEWMLISLLRAKRINLRKIYGYPILNPPIYKFKLGKSIDNKYSDYRILVLFHFLYGFYGSWQEVGNNLMFLSKYFQGDALENLYSESSVDPDTITILVVTECSPFIVDPIIFSRLVSLANAPEPLGYSDLLSCSLKFSYVNGKLQFQSASNEFGPVDLNVFEVLSQTFNFCLKRHILR